MTLGTINNVMTGLIRDAVRRSIAKRGRLHDQVYVLRRDADDMAGQVFVGYGGPPLKPRLDLWSHSPTGFNWGYNGSGPAQLALALLADALGDDQLAITLYQPFKNAFVAGLDQRTDHQFTVFDVQLAAGVVALSMLSASLEEAERFTRMYEEAAAEEARWEKELEEPSGDPTWGAEPQEEDSL